jgi:2-succinyl-6-hydroxy-2,4-cyclohexadiene-1-carboxylate synthase
VSLSYSDTDRTSGDKTILFLHGFMGSRGDWNEIAASMTGWRCVAVDLPGHGETAAQDDLNVYSMAGACKELAGLLDMLRIDRCAVAGYSMGGRLALHFARAYPERVERLVLESASPGLRTDGERNARRQYDQGLARRLESGDFESFLRKWYDVPLFASLRRDRTRFESLFTQRMANRPAELAKSLRGMGTGIQDPLWDELGAYTIPTLLLTGALDAKFVEIAEAMAALCPAMTSHVVPDCGHNIHFEQVAEYTEVLLDFLSR